MAHAGVFNHGSLEGVLMGNFLAFAEVNIKCTKSCHKGTRFTLYNQKQGGFWWCLFHGSSRKCAHGQLFPPPGHFRVAYLAPASGMCGPSVASGGGPT